MGRCKTDYSCMWKAAKRGRGCVGTRGEGRVEYGRVIKRRMDHGPAFLCGSGGRSRGPRTQKALKLRIYVVVDQGRARRKGTKYSRIQCQCASVHALVQLATGGETGGTGGANLHYFVRARAYCGGTKGFERRSPPGAAGDGTGSGTGGWLECYWMVGQPS